MPHLAEIPQRIAQRAGPFGHPGCEPLDPDQRRCHPAGRDMCRAADLLRPAKRAGHGGNGPVRVQVAQHQRGRGFGRRDQLQRHLGQHTQHAMRTSHHAGQVVAGDVLHHPAAGFDDRAGPVDETRPDHRIARRARTQAPWPRRVHRHRPAEGRLPGRAGQHARVARLERKRLTLGGQCRLNLGHRGARPRDQRQRARLVERDAGKARGAQNRRAAGQAARAATLNP
jgi:hypothetical protein